MYPTQGSKPDPLVTPSPRMNEAQIARAHRVERYQAMGFTEGGANLLADVRDARDHPLYHGQVQNMLDKGCSHELVLRILV